ncbi:MAG: FlgD immunoglobulin-like domain containing protein [Bacteroidota bacterium]|nr:FlgD immunoglobulin-like domain containing protein [Bacteroidota bacterium]
MKKSLTLLSFFGLLLVAVAAQAQLRTGTGDFFNITRTIEQTADSVTFVTDTLSVYDSGAGVGNFMDRDSVVIMFVNNRFKIVNNMLSSNLFDYIKVRVVTSSPGMTVGRQTYNNVVTSVGTTGAAYGVDPATSGREIGLRPVYRPVGNIATSSPFFPKDPTLIRQVLTFQVFNPTASGDGIQIRNIYFKPNINNLTGLATPPDTTKDTLRAYHVIGNVQNQQNAGDVVSYTDIAIVRLLPGTTQYLVWVNDSAQAIDAGEYIGSFGDYSRGRYFLGDDGLPLGQSQTLQFRPSVTRTLGTTVLANPDYGMMVDGFPPERNPLKFTNLYQALAPYWYNEDFPNTYPAFPGAPGSNPNPECGLIPPYRVGPHAVSANPYQPGLVTSGVDTLRFLDAYGNRTWDRVTQPRLKAIAYTDWNPRGEDRTVYLKGYQAADDTLRQFGQMVFRRLTYVHADVGRNSGGVEDSVRILAEATVWFDGQGGFRQSMEAVGDTSGGFPRVAYYSRRLDEALLDNSTRVLEAWQIDPNREPVDPLGANHLPNTGLKIVVRPNIPRALDIEPREPYPGAGQTADRIYLRLDVVATDGWGNTVDDNEKFKFELSNFGHLTFTNPPNTVPYRMNGIFDSLITTVPQVVLSGLDLDSGRLHVINAPMGRATRIFRIASGSHNAGAYRIRVRATYAFNDRYNDFSDPLKLDPYPGPGFVHAYLIPDGSPNNNFGIWFGPGTGYNAKLGNPVGQTTAMDSTDVYWDGTKWYTFPVNPRLEVVTGTGDALVVGSVGPFTPPGKPKQIYDKLYVRITDIYRNPLDIAPYFDPIDRQKNRVWVELVDNPQYVDMFNAGLTNKVFFGSVSPNVAWRGSGSPVPYDCPTNPQGFEPTVPEGLPNAGQTLQAELVNVPAGQGLPGIQGDIPSLATYNAVRFYLRAPRNVKKIGLDGVDVVRLKAHLTINTNIPNVGDFSIESGFAEVSIIPDVVNRVQIFKSWGKPAGTTVPMEGWSPISTNDALAAGYPTGTPKDANEVNEFYKGYFFQAYGADPAAVSAANTTGPSFPTPLEGSGFIGSLLASDIDLDHDATCPIPMDTVMVSEHNQQMRIVARLLDQYSNPIGGRLVKFFVESETLPITLPKTQLQNNAQRGGFGEFGKVFVTDDTLKRTTIGDTTTAGWVTAYYVSGRVAHQIVRIALTPDTLAFDLSDAGHNLGEGTAVGPSYRGFAPRVIIPLFLISGPTVRVQIFPYTAAATSPVPLPVDYVSMQALEHVSIYADTRGAGYAPYFHAYSANPFFVEKRYTHMGRAANTNIRPYIPDTLNLTDSDPLSVNSITAGRTVALVAREYDKFGNLVDLQIKPPYDQTKEGSIIDTGRIKFRIWGDNFGAVPAPYGGEGGSLAPSRDWTRDEYGPMRKARYRHTQISNLVAGVHINQTAFLTALEYPTPKTSNATVFFEAWADAWPDPTRPGPTNIIRDTCKVVSVVKTPTRFDILRAGQEYLVSEAGRWLYVNEPETRTINIMAPQISLPPGSDPLQHQLDAVGVDNIMISQAYKRNVSEAPVGKYLVVNDGNVPLDRDGDPLYVNPDDQSINPNFERDPDSNLPRFQKLDVYNNLSPMTAPNNRYNVLNDDMQVKLGYTIPGARSDVPQTFFDLTIAGGGTIYSTFPLQTNWGTLPYEGIGWHVVAGRASNQRPVLFRVTPIWENDPPTGGNPYVVMNQPGQNPNKKYGRLYADSIYTYTGVFGGMKENSLRGELMGTFTDRGRAGSYAPQTNGEFDRVTRIGASGWRAEDFTIAGLNGMARSRNAAGVWGGINSTGGLWVGDYNRRVILLHSAFGISTGNNFPIAPGAFLRLVDSTTEQVIDLRIVDPTLRDMAGNVVDDTCSYDQGKWTVVRKHQRLNAGLWHLDDTYWRGGDGIEDGILGPNANAQFVSDEPYDVPQNRKSFGMSAPEAAAVRGFFGPTGSRKLRHTFVVVPYRIAFLSLFPSSYDPGQGMFDNTRLPLGILPVQADIDTLPRVNLGIYNDGMHDGSNWEMYTRLYGQIPHGATDQIPNNANQPYARPDTIFRDFRYVYNVTPYDRFGNHNTRDTMFVQVGARLTDWTFTNLEPSGTLIIRSGGNFFGAIPINTPNGPDNTNFRQDTLRLFNPWPQTNVRNDWLGIKPDDRRLTLTVGEPGPSGMNIPHGLLPANVISSRPVWIKQAFAPAPFVLSSVLLGNTTLFRMDHVGGCQGNGLEQDILRLNWSESRWTSMPGKNNPNDTVKYEWYGIIDSVGTSSTGQLVVSILSDNNGISPTLTITGDKLRQLIFRPNVQPQPNTDSCVMRVKWFVRAFNKAGLSTYSDTAGVTIRNNPLPTPALIVSINRPPENPPVAVQPTDNATISGLGPTSPPIDVIWTAARDRNIDKGILIGGFKVYNVGSQSWIDDPSGRTVDTLQYQWIGMVVRTFPVGKGAPIGTMLVKNTGTTTGFQLTATDLDLLFAGFDTDVNSTSADSVILNWMVYVKDFNWTDTSPIEEVTFRYNPDGSMVADTTLWSRFGCRPHELASRWFRLNLTKLDVGGVEIDPMAADPDINKIAGEEVEFVLTAKDKNGNTIRDWDIKGVPVTLTITGSTANTDSSNQSWNSDPLAYTWAVITHNGQNLTQMGPNDFSIPPSAFVNGVARIKITHTKAENGVQIVVTPVVAGLNQTSAKMNFLVGGITNYLVELTSATYPTLDQVFLMRIYEIMVSPRDRFLNVSNDQIQTRFSARFPGEFDNTLPGLSDIFSGDVFITGPTNYFVASRIARIKNRDELQWIKAFKSTDPSINGQTAPYEILDHAPNAFALQTPDDHSVIKLQLSSNQEVFTWEKAVPQDPYTDIKVSRFDPPSRLYSDEVRYTIVFVDSISLTRAVKFESDQTGKLPSYTTTQGQLANLLETISGQKTQDAYNVVWYVEASDGLYKTLSTPPNADPNQRPGYRLYLDKDGILGVPTADVPKTFELGQNYPNPFNPTTTITYSLPKSTPVTLVVYDLLGTPVKTLVNETKEAGTYRVTWDATNDLGQQVPSGNYIFKIVAGDFTQTRKMTLLK